jgi:hypothetical protein
MPHRSQKHRVGGSFATIRSRSAGRLDRAVVAVVQIVCVPQKSADLAGDVLADSVEHVLISLGYGGA